MDPVLASCSRLIYSDAKEAIRKEIAAYADRNARNFGRFTESYKSRYGDIRAYRISTHMEDYHAGRILRFPPTSAIAIGRNPPLCRPGILREVRRSELELRLWEMGDFPTMGTAACCMAWRGAEKEHAPDIPIRIPSSGAAR